MINKGGFAGFIIGSIIGSVAMYVYSKAVLEKKKNQEINAELAKIRKAEVNRREKEKDRIKKREEAADKAVADVIEEAAPSYNSKESLEEFAKRRGYHDYTTKISSKDVENKANFLGIRAYESEEEYADSEFYSLTYYYDGKEVTDEEGHRVNMSFAGDLDLDQLFAGENKIYIRNEILECDYEVVWDDDSPNRGGDKDEG